jgi:hypothetical protein
MSAVRRRRQSSWTVFAPLVWTALATSFGLFIALTGDGARDLLAWPAVGVPVGVAVWALHRRRC